MRGFAKCGSLLSAIGGWSLLFEVLDDTEGMGDTIWMIDSIVIRVWHCSAGEKNGHRSRIWRAIWRFLLFKYLKFYSDWRAKYTTTTVHACEHHASVCVEKP